MSYQYLKTPLCASIFIIKNHWVQLHPKLERLDSSLTNYQRLGTRNLFLKHLNKMEQKQEIQKYLLEAGVEPTSSISSPTNAISRCVTQSRQSSSILIVFPASLETNPETPNIPKLGLIWFCEILCIYRNCINNQRSVGELRRGNAIC